MMTTEELRGLDAEIAEKVMGFVSYTDTYYQPPVRILFPPGMAARFNTDDAPGYTRGGGLCQWVPHYSTDIAAAWQVVLKMSSRGVVAVEEIGPYRGDDDGHANCAITLYGDEEEDPMMIMRAAETAPLAICLAAIAVQTAPAAQPGGR